MKVDVYKTDGQASGKKINLSDTIFAAPQKEHLVYLAVKAQLANMRQGTHAVKNRSAVRGGGKKPWKQKGRGVARAGTIRSPLWVGGGRVFGPEPRDYSQKVNKKAKKIARRSILSARLQENRLRVLDDFGVDSGKTKDMAAILSNFEIKRERVLLIVDDAASMLLRASKNIHNLQVVRAELVSVYDLLRSKQVFLQKSAVAKLEEVLA